MAINSISPTTYTSGVLITDTTNIVNGTRSAINAKITPSTALDVQSTLGAIRVPNMTMMERLDLRPSDGMIVYDTTLGLFQWYVNGAWDSGGDITGPSVSAVGNIATFADTTGKVLKDSGVNIDDVPQPFALRDNPNAPVTDVQLSQVDILSYKDVGIIFTGGHYVVGFHPNTFVGRPPNTVFGFANPSSADATVELTQGALLVSRLTQAEIDALIAVDGMITYNTDTDKFNFHQDLSWISVADNTAKFILQTADTNLPNAQALGALATGLLKNTTTTGVLSIAVGGTDYYGPGNPTTIIDTGLAGNFFIGTGAGASVGSGGNNTGVGHDALMLMGSTSTANVALGAGAGVTYPIYAQCTFLGAATDGTQTGLTNATAIGYNAKVDAPNSLVLGDVRVNVGIGNSNPPYLLTLGGNSNNAANFFMANSGGDPSTPTGGGLLYVVGGALKYRGSSGTITTLAPA